MANQIQLVMYEGYMADDPDMRFTPDGKGVVNFRMGSNRKYKKANGEEVKETTWLKVSAWGKLAEICSEYLKKGSPVYIEGRIQTRSWEDKEGIKKYTTEIVANSMQMLGSKQAREREEKKPGADYEPINIYEPISIPESDIPF